MNNGTPNLGPDFQGRRQRLTLIGRLARDFDEPLFQFQLLPERAPGEWIRRQADPHTPQLEIFVVLRNASTALHVEEHIAILHPDIEADVPPAARHGAGSIGALRIPDDVVWLKPRQIVRPGSGMSRNGKQDQRGQCSSW